MGGVYLVYTRLITFEIEKHRIRLPQQIDFQIQVVSCGINIFGVVVDEGAFTCIMSLSC
jgi:hypothetical protein